jgi:hypothetical protein
MAKINDQLKIDNEEILRLLRIISPTGNDMNSIFNLYQKYVDANVRSYNPSGCSTCGNSIVRYWRELGMWYEANKTNVFGV